MSGYYVSLTREDGQVMDDDEAGTLPEIRKAAARLAEKMGVGDCIMIFPGENGSDEDGEEE